MLNFSKIKEIAAGKTKVTEEYLRSLNIHIEQVPMSYEIKGLTIPYGTWYNIKINSIIPDDQKWSAFLHELVHVVRNDCFNDRPAKLAEATNPY